MKLHHFFLPAIFSLLGIVPAVSAPRTTERTEPAGSVVYASTEMSRSLSGEWHFQLARNAEANAEIKAPQGFPGSLAKDGGWSRIRVPGHWDIQGFIEPQYTAPIGATGYYQRTFTVDEAWKGQRVFLRFEGVLYGFEVWVNGQAVGSWGSGYHPVTFDITDRLNGSGENNLSVKVTTTSFARGFDCNDCWGLAGIYRDVGLFALPEKHLRSWTARTTVRGDGTAHVVFPVAISDAAAGGTVTGSLTGPDGEKRQITFQSVGTGRFEGTLDLPQDLLWHAERPLRHHLDLALRRDGEVVHDIHTMAALREVRVDGTRILINGHPVRLRGVNHHDIWPDSGRTATLDQIRHDVKMIVEMNANFIRTSHYPPDHRLIDLCEEAGLFVMCEVPFGFGDEYLKNPDYTPELLARAAATVRRDTHHGAIIIWSLGNENPVTDSTVETAAYVKNLDPTRPVCFPMTGNTFFENQAWGRKTPPVLDVHAAHYPGIERVRKMPAEIQDRPLVMTEFAHALSLGGDGLQSIWDHVLQHDTPTGGALWMFQDQGILRRKSDQVKPHPYAVALDEERFFDTQSTSGADGLTYSDRVPKTNYWQARAVYAPVRVTSHRLDDKGGLAFHLTNHHDLRPLTGMTGTWHLFTDGIATAKGSFSSGIEARGQGEVRIQLPPALPTEADVAWIELALTDPEGRHVLIDSLALRKPAKAFDQVTANPSAAGKWARWFIGGETPAIRLRVGRPDGMLMERWGGKNKQDAHWRPHLLAPADCGLLEESRAGGNLELSRRFTFVRGDFPEQSIAGIVRCTLPASGPVRVDYDFHPREATGIWLEAGLSFAAPEGAHELHWIGRGPYATCPGKNLLGTYGRHALHRDDLYFDGNRQETGAALFIGTDGQGIGLLPVGDGFNLAVERTDTGVMIGHNSLVSGVGTKFRMPDITAGPANHPELKGCFRVLPLQAGTWPAEIDRLFGRERSHPRAFRPYLDARQ
jgi:beta-galactosidase